MPMNWDRSELRSDILLYVVCSVATRRAFLPWACKCTLEGKWCIEWKPWFSAWPGE